MSGCLAVQSAPASSEAKKWTKWQKLMIVSVSNGCSRRRNDSAAPAGLRLRTPEPGTTASETTSPVVGQLDSNRVGLPIGA